MARKQDNGSTAVAETVNLDAARAAIEAEKNERLHSFVKAIQELEASSNCRIMAQPFITQQGTISAQWGAVALDNDATTP